MTALTDLLGRDLFSKVRFDARRADAALASRADVFPYFLPVGSALGREVIVDGEPKLMFGSSIATPVRSPSTILRWFTSKSLPSASSKVASR